MGGDHGPSAVIPAVIQALSLLPQHVRFMLHGDGARLLGEIGRTRSISSAHAQNVLGWKPRPPEESIIDCARSLIEHGVVKV